MLFVCLCRLAAAFWKTRKGAIIFWLDLTFLARLTMALPRWLDMPLVEVILPKVCIPNPMAACEVHGLVRRSIMLWSSGFFTLVALRPMVLIVLL